MPERYKVIITDYVHDELAPEREVLGDIADVAALNAFSEEELAGRIEDAHAIMCYHHHPISALTIERLKQCRIIARSGVGVDSIDLACAKAHGIPVTNVPDYGTEEVADSALALALSLARGTHAANSRLRAQDGPWDNTQVAPLPRLRGASSPLSDSGASAPPPQNAPRQSALMSYSMIPTRRTGTIKLWEYAGQIRSGSFWNKPTWSARIAT